MADSSPPPRRAQFVRQQIKKMAVGGPATDADKSQLYEVSDSEDDLSDDELDAEPAQASTTPSTRFVLALAVTDLGHDPFDDEPDGPSQVCTTFSTKIIHLAMRT